MNGMQASVEQFHSIFGHPVADSPTLPSKEQAELRIKLIQEELDELEQAFKEGDLVGAYDAVIDLLVVVFGTAGVMGTEAAPGFKEVMRSNFSKLDENGEPVPHPTIPGKIGKSELYSPPNLEPILEGMGWRG